MELKKINKNKTWCLYILQCADGSLYTGITNNLKNRLKQHSTGKGSKYTRSHLPIKLVYSKKYLNKSIALKQEIFTKQLSRKKKLMLINKKSRHTNIVASYLILKKNNKILMLRRFNTGYKDNQYSLVAGHVENEETFKMALIREAKEEANIKIIYKDIKTIHVMHRKSDTDGSQRVDVFHLVENYQGKIKNMETDKCSDLSWFDINKIPKNTIPYIKMAINHIKNNNFYSEYGW